MGPAESALLVGGGFVAGVANTLAGGGSLLTVPLLVLLGLPGTVANGTNRVGVLVQGAAGTWRFRAEGVAVFRESLAVGAPVVLGSVAGALWISRASPETFERLFGIVMLIVLVPILRSAGPSAVRPARPWPRWLATLVYLAIGVYGGAFQAGVQIFLLFALARAGLDLVRANAVKVVVVTTLTAGAVPVFAAAGQVAWGPAALLAAGYFGGAVVGTRLAVRGGEGPVRVVVALAAVVLAGHLLGLY